jgi:hypothetical protein
MSTRFLRIRGDSAELVINATDPVTGAAFDLEAMENVIFTAKANLTDADAAAIFQKELGAGIAVAVAVATVTVIYIDTLALAGRATTLYCDLQAQDSDGNVTTVWIGTVTFQADVTRGVSPAIPIYTLQPTTQGTYPRVRADLTGLTGGASTDLDGVVTYSDGVAAIPTNTVFMLTYGRIQQVWQLIAGTDAEAPASGVVRPDDYDGSTNARIWVQL